MRRIGKKAVAVMLAVALTMSMTACGKQGEKKTEKTNEEKNEARKEMVYQGEEFSLDGLKGDVSTIFAKGDKIYISTYEWIEETNGSGNDDSAEEEVVQEDETETSEEETTEEETTEEETTAETEEETTEESDEDQAEETDTSEESAEGESSEEEVEEYYPEGYSVMRYYRCDLDGSNVEEISVPELDENEYADRMIVDNNGNMLLIISSYNEKSSSMNYSAVIINEDGTASDKVDITKELGAGQDTYISSIAFDDNKNLYAFMDQAVVVLDENFKKVCEIKSDSYLSGGMVTKDGTVMCGASDEKGAFVQEVDVKSKSLGERIDLDISYFSGSDSLISGNGDYDFYYKDDSGIYGYSVADKKSKKLMDYVASDLNSDSTYGIVPINDELMIGTQWGEDEKSTLVRYTKVDPSTIADKQIITCAAMYLDDNIRRAAVEFNKTNDKYRIDFKDYSSEEDPQTKMNADIVAGNIPDIICLSSLPVDQYVAKGILEDLTPYFEKDEEISTDDMVPALYNAIQTDGKMYYITTGFGVSTLVASKKDVGDKDGWTFKELKELLDSKGKDARPFYSTNKSDMLYSFLGNSITDYIDWSTGECRFDSDDFRSILEICNERGSNDEMEYSEDMPSTPTLIKEGKLLFNEGWVSFDEVQLYKAMYDGEVSFIGYPCEDKKGSYFQLENQMGIYSKSDMKEGAWEFVRTFMTKKYQGGNNGYYYSFPSRQDCFDMMVKARTTKEKYTDEFGNEVMPYDSSWGYDDLEVKIGPSSEEEVEMLKNLINNTTKVACYNYDLITIIVDEAKAYFNGDKSIEDTMNIIQNRMTTYVNENR